MSIIKWSHITVKDLTQVSNIPWSEDCDWDMFLDKIDYLVNDSPNPYDIEDVHSEYYCQKECIELNVPVPTNSHMRGFSSVEVSAMKLERIENERKLRRLKVTKIFVPRKHSTARKLRSTRSCNQTVNNRRTAVSGGATDRVDYVGQRKRTKRHNLRLFNQYRGIHT